MGKPYLRADKPKDAIDAMIIGGCVTLPKLYRYFPESYEVSTLLKISIAEI